jgi:2,4-dienoyl-CoA reductase-like NADH-dependent reductase (Old Yellow Enzyme family)/thioredoxin reductase
MVIRGKTIKNRCAVSAMVTNYCTPDGKATEKYIAYHEAKAKGGFGLIITEDYAVDALGKGFSFVAGLWDENQIAGHSELPKRVHQYGAVILAQIYHCGRQTNFGVIKQAPYAPTAIPCPFGTDVPIEFTAQEIKGVVQKFGDTALRAKKCGFDGVEIHGGHGYLVAEFLSSYSNKRVDAYGGSFLNRARFLLEVIQDIRAKCGDDFIIDLRISGDEMIEGGRTLEDTKALVPLVEAAGLDMIHISAGTYASCDAIVPPSYTPHGWIADMASEIKKITHLPVITVGRINDPFLADSIIGAGKADFAAMGRASLADPDLPNKAQAGEFEDIRPCIGCNYGCLELLFADTPIKCVLNPTLGIESESTIHKTRQAKKIAVIGAGPAGLEAALAAKKAGHSVTVYEKENHAGGQFYLAAIPPCKGEIADFIAWQLTQCRKLDIPIRYQSEATLELMQKEKPDVVVLASGATPVLPNIKGADQEHVVFAQDILAGKANPGYNCVVIGGGQVGAETANYLGQQLKSVVILEMLEQIAGDEALAPRWHLLKALENRKVQMHTGVAVNEITASSVKATGKSEMEFPANTVVIATGAKPGNDLKNALTSAGFEVKVVGSANKAGIVMDATAEGFEAGRNL